MITAREVALEILYDIDVNEAYANIALDRHLRKYGPAPADRAFITEVVYGAVRYLLTLDWIIEQFSDRPVARMTPWIRNILRMGVYQIKYLSSVPPAVAVNEAVELAKKHGHPGTVRFVNGVLRNIARRLPDLAMPSAQTDPVEHLAVAYSHPRWLVALWLKRWGFAETAALCAANNLSPQLEVRANTLKISREDLQQRFHAAGIDAQPVNFAPEGLRLHRGLDAVSAPKDGVASESRDAVASGPKDPVLSALEEGLCYAQDESSMLVAHILDPRPGEDVLDACSAPGGKTTHLAQLMENRGRIVAVDDHEHKLGLVAANCARLGIGIVQTLFADARRLGGEAIHREKYDRILVDAPCSGLGVLRRRADARWRKSPESLAALPELQSAILQSAADCLKPGGTLVYSTCTVEPAENEEVVERFLADHPDFVREEIGSFLKGRWRWMTQDVVKEIARDGYLRLFPHRHGTDGFFAARLRKKEIQIMRRTPPFEMLHPKY